MDSAVEDIEELRAAIQAILDERVQPIIDAAEEVELPEEPEEPEPVVDTDAEPYPLIDSQWSFAEQTDALKADRDYET